MGLSKFDINVENIQELDDNPNISGLTARDLKVRFDQAGMDIKEYLNGKLTEELDVALSNTNTTISNLNTTFSGEIGDVSSLTTTDKSNLVNAINGVNTELNQAKSTIPKYARGTTALITVGGNNHKDIAINYSGAGFTSNPTVVATLNGNSPSQAHGNSDIGVVTNSITTTGATLRYYNNNSSSLSMYINWIAIGE